MELSLHGSGLRAFILVGGDRMVGIRVTRTTRGADASRAASATVARLTREGVTTLRERATRTVDRLGEQGGAASSTVTVEPSRQNFITSSSSPTGRGAVHAPAPGGSECA
ncbi:hypothetical protein PRIPAC_91361 [Pristionchus pacificus]|uniref:Uncharacterized protein n=1 Tax=Pristionchus pacificus TaxID=54126 RepID=A0A2A6B7A3_PRIPA|nr:hypothetical protein PRIPAC_91361 [Pristionchus pacificus]|eukprot:PDM61769.1 hypothetical protein PRIPAC_51211 [Pristionchus pacificus]